MTRTGVVFGMVLLAVSLSVAGCGGGGGSPSSPSGTASVQGQVLREPTVRLSGVPTGLWARIRAALGAGEASAAPSEPVPVLGMQVSLSVDGRPMASTTTDGAGRFRFDGMPAGTSELHMQDPGGRDFRHSVSLDRSQTMATYCVFWGDGAGVQMRCADEPGDHWEEMMQGRPAGRWDTGAHGWQGGMMR